MKIQKLDEALSEILTTLEESESDIDLITSQVHKAYALSAKNLCRYLILRSFDLRKYHDSLSDLGVSSMRASEAYVYHNLYSVVRNLRLIQKIPFDKDEDLEVIGYKGSKKLIRKHANSLFNESSKKHFTEIMVTLPEEAAEDKSIIEDMVNNGMEIARINLSHGNIDIWSKMVKYIDEIKRKDKQKIKIYMDLAGPKIRTSNIEILGKKGKAKEGITIKKGEHIILTKRATSGKESKFGKNKEQLEKAEIGVMLHEIIDDMNINDVVLFDDGMIKAVVIAKEGDDAELVITNCYKNKLSSRKGINLPNTKLNLPALTESDIETLPFICQHADIVGYSFVRTGQDVEFLYRHLDKNNAENLGVVFKIENKEAFENLPQILLSGMKRDKIGVMIARGDLAVEMGFERVSEVQNQILWICEAAHIPVIWATQVLENLAKTGIPTRAEISDAAQGAQAECVMLNKGPYITEAIRTLKDILTRMEAHSFKKKGALRALNVAKNSMAELREAVKLQSAKE
ncbi:MAG: pyruvate kinase [Phaeodactylibacter sp.]|nr:pyruvate kinase [Phaeodactylibacter sp.]